MMRPLMKSTKVWESVGSFFRPGIRLRSSPNWKVFWTPNGYQLMDGGITVHYFKHLHMAKRQAEDTVKQSERTPGSDSYMVSVERFIATVEKKEA